MTVDKGGFRWLWEDAALLLRRPGCRACCWWEGEDDGSGDDFVVADIGLVTLPPRGDNLFGLNLPVDGSARSEGLSIDLSDGDRSGRLSDWLWSSMAADRAELKAWNANS